MKRFLLFLAVIAPLVMSNHGAEAREFVVNKKLSWTDTLPGSLSLFSSLKSSVMGDIPLYCGSYNTKGSVNVSFDVISVSYLDVPSEKSAYFDESKIPDNISFNYTAGVSREQTVVNYSFPAVVRDKTTGKTRRIASISFKVTEQQIAYEKSSSSSSHSVLAQGRWYKFEVIKDGVYIVTNKELKRLGIKVSSSVRVFTGAKHDDSELNKSILVDDLQECTVQYFVGNDGVFNNNDYLLFWGEGPDRWKYNATEDFFDHKSDPYSARNYYYLLVDDGSPVTVASSNYSDSPDYDVTSFDDRDYYEKNESNVLKSGKEWFESISTKSISFSFNNASSSTYKAKIRLVGLSSSAFSFKVTANSLSKTIILSSGSDYTSSIQTLSTTTADGSVSLGIESIANGSDLKTYLDYVVVNIRRNLVYPGKLLRFRDSKAYLKARAPRYNIQTSKPLQVWNVSDALKPTKVSSSYNSGSITFTYPSNKLEEFVAFDYSDCLIPFYTGEVSNQDIHGAQDIEMVIVSADNFLSHASRLQQLHLQDDGIHSLIVTQEQVFNEFSGGRIDALAIRNMARYLYEKEDKRLEFLLLLGDGSYNNMDIDTKAQVITYQSNASLVEISSFVSDDFFGMLDVGEGVNANGVQTGLVDVSVGRIPVSTTTEAETVIGKIEGYVSDSKFKGAWRNKLIFLADDADEGQTEHMNDASTVADSVVSAHPYLIADKIFLDAYPQVTTSGGERYPAVNKEIESKMKSGCLVFNYSGHGNQLRMAQEVVVEKAEVDKWENKHTLPVFITASCQVGRYDDETRKSLGEEILLSQHGGGIALMTTTRLVYQYDNRMLDEQIFDHMFERTSDGKAQTLGHIMRLSKNALTTDNDNKYNFTLLGDPAMRIASPSTKVVTDKINGTDVASKTDTIKALSQVSVSGHIEDLNGNTLSDYTGELVATIFDKPQTIKTLGNDEGDPVSFKAQNNILFKGKAKVEKGVFSFNFVVPKDIFYNYGKGRISYYCDNGTDEGAGSFTNFIVGGNSSSINDANGPSIELFMNDTTFVNGGTTDESPTLLIKTSDENGINVSGTAVGHDATAIIDGATADQIVLNEFYEADPNTYKSGKFKYPVSQLAEGIHNVKVKVWDVNNNSSEDYLEFYVTSSSELALKHVLNYPNPFTTSTNFYFEHNQEDQILDVLVQIYTVSGKLVKTISTTCSAEGYRSAPIHWDGRDDYGDRIGRGVYIYKLRVKNESDKTAHQIEKLVILK